jgi:hypothetical protein
MDAALAVGGPAASGGHCGRREAIEVPSRHNTPIVLGVETVEGGDLAVFVDGGEEVQGPRGWVFGEGAVDSATVQLRGSGRRGWAVAGRPGGFST